MGRFDLVIFDCDGVLVDSERVSNEVFATMLREEGCPATLDLMFERFVGHSMPQCLQLIQELWGKTLGDDFVLHYRARVKAAFELSLKAVPGIEAVIDSLDCPYCVASSGSHEKMKTTLGITGLISKFENRRFSVSEVKESKPAPDVFLYAAQKMGVAPERCAVIEDSPSGVRAGLAAGMSVFAFAAMTSKKRLKEAGAAVIFDSMIELPKLLGVQ
ncbi:MAG: HAD family hydrolase [Planctomycetota bacterium]|nr:HAD family hydrolase [Planctomycetota bacterium]